MNERQIINAFFKGECDKIKDQLPDCELLSRQFKNSLKGVCSCKHTGIRNKFRHIVRKNIKN